MPKFPTIPRLSIVVPVGDDLAAFENSLVSVLENRPSDAEVLVAHDGNYDDPFDLGDEVRFVTCGDNRSVDLVAQAATEARGRFVHVLAGGWRATEGWTEAAVEAFDDAEVGVVVPLLRRDSGTIAAAGWEDTPSRLCAPAFDGARAIDRSAARRIGGPYLSASFWRREVLRSLRGCYEGPSTAEASYVYAHLAQAEGWQLALAPACELLCPDDAQPGGRAGFRRGCRMRAIRQRLTGGGTVAAIGAAARAMAGNIFGGRLLVEAIGQAAASSAAAEIRRQVKRRVVHDRGGDNFPAISFPRRDRAGLRRAA